MKTYYFYCEKYHCTLTTQACVDRQTARIERIGCRCVPAYPGCRNCEQGLNIKTALTMAQTEEEKVKRNKIDPELLKKRLNEGKFIDEIADEIGVSIAGIKKRMQKMELTYDYRRQKSIAEKKEIAELLQETEVEEEDQKAEAKDRQAEAKSRKSASRPRIEKGENRPPVPVGAPVAGVPMNFDFSDVEVRYAEPVAPLSIPITLRLTLEVRIAQ